MSVKKTIKDNAKILCPVCKGQGIIDEPLSKQKKTKRDAVALLVDSGFTYREVMRLMGYRSPGSVQKILKPQHGKQA